jgi:hypothetical protein
MAHPTAEERRSRPPIWIGVVGIALVLLALTGLVLVVARRNDMPVVSLTQDPMLTTGLRWQTGFLYKGALLIWGVIAGTCFLGAASWRRAGGMGPLPAFLLTSGVLALVLAVDDTFQLRGEIYDHIGLPEIGVFAIYAVVLCVIAVAFWRTLVRTEFIVLAAAVVLFVLWLTLRQAGIGHAVGDFVRLAGQLVLLLYLFRTAAYGLTLTRESGAPSARGSGGDPSSPKHGQVRVDAHVAGR